MIWLDKSDDEVEDDDADVEKEDEEAADEDNEDVEDDVVVAWLLPPPYPLTGAGAGGWVCVSSDTNTSLNSSKLIWPNKKCKKKNNC